MTATLKPTIKSMLIALSNPSGKLKLGPLQICSHQLLNDHSLQLELSDGSYTIHGIMHQSVHEAFLNTNGVWKHIDEIAGSIIQLHNYEICIDISLNEFYIHIMNGSYLGGANDNVISQPMPYQKDQKLRDLIKLYRTHSIASLGNNRDSNVLIHCGMGHDDVMMKWNQIRLDWDKQCMINENELTLVDQQWKPINNHNDNISWTQQPMYSQFTQSLPDSYVPITVYDKHKLNTNINQINYAISINTTNIVPSGEQLSSPTPLTPVIDTHIQPPSLHSTLPIPIDINDDEVMNEQAKHSDDDIHDDSTSPLKRCNTVDQPELRDASEFHTQCSLRSESNLYNNELQSSPSDYTTRTQSTVRTQSSTILSHTDDSRQPTPQLNKRMKINHITPASFNNTQQSIALAQPNNNSQDHINNILPPTQLQLLNDDLIILQNTAVKLSKQLNANIYTSSSQIDEYEHERQHDRYHTVRQQHNRTRNRISEINNLLQLHHNAVSQQQQQSNTDDDDSTMSSHHDQPTPLQLALQYIQSVCDEM